MSTRCRTISFGQPGQKLARATSKLVEVVRSSTKVTDDSSSFEKDDKRNLPGREAVERLRTAGAERAEELRRGAEKGQQLLNSTVAKARETAFRGLESCKNYMMGEVAKMKVGEAYCNS